MALAPSGGLMRDLTAVVQISALPMFNAGQDLTLGGPIGSEFIRHDDSGHVAQTLQQLAKEALGRLRVAAALDQHIKHVAVLVYRPPEVVQLAADADKYLIQKPFVSWSRSAPLEGFGVGPSEAQAPLADGLVANHDAARCQDQLDFPQAQAEAVIQPNGLVDDLSREAEAVIRIGHGGHGHYPAISLKPLPT
jgi:hypothetical protein